MIMPIIYCRVCCYGVNHVIDVSTHKDDELAQFFVPEAHQFFRACEEPLKVKLKRYWKTGALFDSEHWKCHLEKAGVGNLTFEEGKILFELGDAF